MKFTILSLFTILFSFIDNNYQDKKAEILTAKLLSIEYYSQCKCSEKSPVLVRVIFKVSEPDVRKLKMKIKYKDGITMNFPVTEKDKKGNIVYDFCISPKKNKEFKICFVKSDGKQSNEIHVKTNASKSNIIDGTAPSTIKTE